MKDVFSEYYQPTEAELEEHWRIDLFSFDANVLLNLYRYTPSTREAFFKLLEKIEDRLWISYQAAFEYQRNRLPVINAQKEAYEDIRKTLVKKKNEIETKLNSFKKHPYLQASDLNNQILSAFEAISSDLDLLEKRHPDYLSKDPIFNRLTEILDGKIGSDLEIQQLEKIYSEGRKRYDQKIPPGYMDLAEKKNQGNRSLYGDLIVWKQLINQSIELKKSIIFVTDDLKQDWWYKFKGKTIGARPELIREFRDETNQHISIYQADIFLEYANKNLKQNTTQDAIEEVRNARLSDEEEIAAHLSNPEIEPEGSKSGFESALDEHIKRIEEGEIDE